MEKAEELTLGFKFKFDNYDTIDCTELRVELFEEGPKREYCVEEGGLYLGVEMCRSRYQLTAGLRYRDKLHPFKEYVNMIGAIPPFALEESGNGEDLQINIESNQPQWNKDNRHEVELKINKDGTYLITVEAKDGSKKETKPGDIAAHFGIRGEEYHIDDAAA